MSFWNGLTLPARIGLSAGAAAILLATALLAWWVFRVEYRVLFADLSPQDAQAMTTELERLKQPYRLGDGGTSILVDKEAVHATRIKLMGRELPLHGAVGLELFNNTDFGMTEFAQKVNYQRALQGELTRTIQSLTEVREVRVLLALPEQGLFKQATSTAKASVTLTLRQGQRLRPEQVAGIQRLVAAAVPGMHMQTVTIVDNQGVALTREHGEDALEPTGSRLALKRETEDYLARKVAAVLDRAFGPGQALASVDVVLGMDQVRTTTEDVLPAASRSGLQPTGVLVREREVLRDAGAPSERRTGDAAGARSASSQREVDYAAGRRVEQVISHAGAIRRVQVAAVVRTTLDAAQEDRLRKLIAAAVGASAERGDTVVVQSLAAGAVQPADTAARGASAPPPAEAPPADAAPGLSGEDITVATLAPALLGLLLAGAAVAALRRGARHRAAATAAPRMSPLTEAERTAALQRVRAWMAEGLPPGQASGGTAEVGATTGAPRP